MHNKWTSNQYNVFRVLFGVYLIVHFSYLIPWSSELFSDIGMISHRQDSPLLYCFPNILACIDSPLFVIFFIILACLSAICFVCGYNDKYAALYMWYVLACLFGRNPLIANPSLPYVGWMLLAHLFIPKTPKNSIDSAIAWKMPTSVHLASWVVLAVSYSYSGYTKLLSPSWLEGKNLLYVLYNPLARDYFLRDFFLRIPSIFLSLITWGILIIELLFAFLILKKRVRPYMWLSMLIVQFGFAFLLSFPDLTIAMLLFHLFTFDPAWLESKAAANSGILFYDGDCGLCHGVVRFLLAEDHRQIFQMSPLQGEKFKTILEPGKQVTMKDSVVLVIKDRALTRSTAIVYLLKNLGGLWTILGYILFFFPKFIRDFGYDCVGTIRHCLFPKPSGFCPILPESLRGRLL